MFRYAPNMDITVLGINGERAGKSVVRISAMPNGMYIGTTELMTFS